MILAEEIKTKKEHEDALARAYILMQKVIKKGSDDENELEVLVQEIQQFESIQYSISSPNLTQTNNSQ